MLWNRTAKEVKTELNRAQRSAATLPLPARLWALVGTTKCRWDDKDGYPLFKRPRFDAAARGEGIATNK
jgi:hypothetical protein